MYCLLFSHISVDEHISAINKSFAPIYVFPNACPKITNIDNLFFTIIKLWFEFPSLYNFKTLRDKKL